MQADFFKNLSPLLSEKRVESYRNVNGTDEDCMCRYLWNTALAEALYPVLHILEVTYRNAVHRAVGRVILASPLNTTDWLLASQSFLSAQEQEKVRGAKDYLRDRGKPLTEDYLVAELSFGFWNSLLDARYERLWHKIIKDVFPQMPKTIRLRNEASARMSKLRNLRNAAYHHHSIWHWGDLVQQHADAHTLIGWIGGPASALAKAADRFPSVYQGSPGPFRVVVDAFTDGSAPAAPGSPAVATTTNP